LFAVAGHNCNIKLVQPRGQNRHAVFLVTESEAVTYNYDLDLRPTSPPRTLAPDPRVVQTLNLSFDELGNVLQSITVGYGRLRQHEDPSLDTAQLSLIRSVQSERHLAYTETHYTNDVPVDRQGSATVDAYRLRVPYQAMTYELSGFTPTNGMYFDLSD